MILGQLNESDFSVFSSEKEENDEHDVHTHINKELW